MAWVFAHCLFDPPSRPYPLLRPAMQEWFDEPSYLDFLVEYIDAGITSLLPAAAPSDTWSAPPGLSVTASRSGEVSESFRPVWVRGKGGSGGARASGGMGGTRLVPLLLRSDHQEALVPETESGSGVTSLSRAVVHVLVLRSPQCERGHGAGRGGGRGP